MLGILGIAIFTGLCAVVAALFSGYSLMAALFYYVLFGWAAILATFLVLGADKGLKKWIAKQTSRHAQISKT